MSELECFSFEGAIQSPALSRSLRVWMLSILKCSVFTNLFRPFRLITGLWTPSFLGTMKDCEQEAIPIEWGLLYGVFCYHALNFLRRSSSALECLRSFGSCCWTDLYLHFYIIPTLFACLSVLHSEYFSQGEIFTEPQSIASQKNVHRLNFAEANFWNSFGNIHQVLCLQTHSLAHTD